MGKIQHTGRRQANDLDADDAARAAGEPQPTEAARPAKSVPPVIGRAFAGGAADDPLGGTTADPEVAAALQRRRGRGAPLPDEVAESMGSQLGTDLGHVRVHHDAEADSIARSVQAQAFTFGSDIYFTQGSYRPGDQAGQHLLAHELAHVVQQDSGTGAPGAGPTIGRADDTAEIDADRVASHVVTGIQRQQASPAADNDGSAAVIRRNGDKTATVTPSPTARKIADGHSYQKHVVDQAEYPDISSKDAFAKLIDDVMKNGVSKNLEGGRTAYWKDGTVVIHNPRATDLGTAFKPNRGKRYFDNLT